MAFEPIFIGGVSFSGKTQLRLMLNMHPNLLITRRTYLWRKFYNRYGDLNRPENLERCLDDICSSKQARVLEPDKQSIRDEFRSGSADYSRLFCLFHQQHARSRGKSRWGIQQSFVECDADLLFKDMPDARILHVVRSPFERVSESVAHSPHRAGKVGWETALWRLSSRWADRNCKRYPDRYMLVHWESLLAEPETVLKNVCAFVAVEYEPGMLTAVDFSAPNPNGRSALSRPEQSFIQVWAKKELDSLGYSSPQEPLRIGEMLTLAFVDYPINSTTAVLSGLIKKNMHQPDLGKA